MQESIGGPSNDPTKCIDEQLKFLEWCENALNEALAIKSEFGKLKQEFKKITEDLQANDYKHDQAIAEIRALVENKHTEVINTLANHTASLDATNEMIALITPWVKWANPIVEKSLKWRNRLAICGAGAIVWLFVSMLNSNFSPAALVEFIKLLLKQA